MTIAACYLSADGLVFGADSTTTMYVPGPDPNTPGAIHHYNFAQKIFQIGENSTLAMTMWGLGNLHNISYRTLIAQFADSLVDQGVQSMEDVANCWNRFFWSAYSSELGEFLHHAQQLLWLIRINLTHSNERTIRGGVWDASPWIVVCAESGV